MSLSQFYRSPSPGLSIEIFPPKTPQGDEGLYRTLDRLKAYRPVFVSCTYGAGGSTQTRTVEICRTIRDQIGLTPTAHFTCVGSTRDQLIEWLKYARENGVQNIMALRGDAPQGQTEFQSIAGGLKYAQELVSLIKSNFPDMGIGVAGYPEKHPEAKSLEADINNLKAKVDAGADAVFTQLFYVNDHFLKWRDRAQKAGVKAPIIPGIMPITEFARIKRITSMCGAEFPVALASRLEAVQDDADAQFEIGVEYAIEQCRNLQAAGIPGMHFYVLNKSQACERILEGLGMKA
jgi:methylenetetrahydrofolate reductase (NADPH)